MKTGSFIILLFASLFHAGELHVSASQFSNDNTRTQKVYLSGTDAANTVEWEFFCTDGRSSGVWTTIPVPSNWELQGFGTYNYGHDWSNPDVRLGTERGLYRHEFGVPASWRGKDVRIVFEGSMTDTRVKVNGRIAGPEHQGGFYRFSYNISSLIRYGGTNLLEVEVRKQSENESINRAERQADYWIFGGIYRPVFLEVKPKIHIAMAAVDAKADGRFNVLVQLSEAPRALSLEIELFDMHGRSMGPVVSKEVAQGVADNRISGVYEGISAWNPEWPQLYDMVISLKRGNEVLHAVTERIGFRTFELRAHDGFYLNGEKVVFKGVNRHSFWPETGRALSEENHLTDILLMKEMHMNAVRMSHYPPDKRFLELCDSLGMLVVDELAGWQQGYDTLTGGRLIRQMVKRDENHPSVVLWANGNEGGWEFESEKWFHATDIQQRPVIYPWLLRNGVDTHHYPSLNYGIAKYHNGNDPFMPTEFLHGLYDGGHGAGLEDYWTHYQSSPLHAGGFLWVFSDEAVLRTDREGLVYDSDGNHAPDGILGPHREKGGSFYTIREVWSPVQVSPVVIDSLWNGRLHLTNKYFFTNLSQCSFSWQAVSTAFGDAASKTLASGSVRVPHAMPGETVRVNIDTGTALERADLFLFTATDPHGREVYTWTWPVVQCRDKAAEVLAGLPAGHDPGIEVSETAASVTARANGLEVEWAKAGGTLLTVRKDGKNVSLGGGNIVGADMPVTATVWEVNPEGSFVFTALTGHQARKVTWKLSPSGLLLLEAELLNNMWGNYDFLGISFSYPEEKCLGVRWMGRGPYRVWKNRIRGTAFGVWEKAYNNTITGESFTELVYPEFKGYHANLYWAVLETTELPVTVISETPNLYFRLFTPGRPQHVQGGTYPPFPEGDLSFLYEIPAIGTKFKAPESLGLRSQQGWHSGHRGEQTYPIKLWFYFGRID